MSSNYLRWLAASVLITAGSGLLIWWAQRWYERGLAELVPPKQRPEPWMVDRPTEVREIVQAVTQRRGAAAMDSTTAVQGAGGFGKTTVARLVRADRRVLRRFDGRVYWVTLGRNARRDALLRPLNDLFTTLGASPAQPFTDVGQAAEYLAAVLAKGPRRLLVLDDVWFDEQLAAFPVAGRCVRLVTTRKPSLVTGQAVPVRVDQMSVEEACRVLTADLPGLQPMVVAALLAETGRWPLLLRLTNRNLRAHLQSHTDLAVVAYDLVQRLHRDGALKAAGQLPDVGDVQQLDVDDPVERSKALAATIEASAGLLTADDRARLTELAIFAEDEAVPVTLIAALWQATGGLDTAQTRIACTRLADLALLTLAATDDGGTVTLHEVIRGYLHQRLQDQALKPHNLLLDPVARVHALLLDTVSASLPRVAPPDGAAGDKAIAWWELPLRETYLREHLVTHLVDAHRRIEAEAVATDLRWVQSRLQEAGPGGPVIDLRRIGSSRSVRLSRLLAQTAHLLTPTDPPHSLVDILYSRVDHDVDWGPQARALSQARTQTALINAGQLPDLPHANLRQVLIGHRDRVLKVAIEPDGEWLVTTSLDGSARIWDAFTGELRAEAAGRSGSMSKVVIAPDGSWFITAGLGSATMWDSVTARLLFELNDHGAWVNALAVARDGTWLASAGYDTTVRIWDAANGRQRAKLSGHEDEPMSLVVAADGNWLASAGKDSTVRIWDVTTARERAKLIGHVGVVYALAVDPQGRWLASAGDDATIRIWDPSSGDLRHVLTGHAGVVFALTADLDGKRLASAGSDATVRVWDPVSGALHQLLTGHASRVSAVAVASDGKWLASASDDQSVRLWDLTDNSNHATPTLQANEGEKLADLFNPSIESFDLPRDLGALLMEDPTRWSDMTETPDGAWLTVSGKSMAAEVWNKRSGRLQTVLEGHSEVVNAFAVAVGSAWIATGGQDANIRIWDMASGELQSILRGHTGPISAMSFSPDNAWLASVSSDGSVRIWSTVERACCAVMRTEKPLSTCVWDQDGYTVTVTGEAGSYTFIVRRGDS
ncbi:NB-ARC domain-containing protein [Micromonospora sp. NPDC048170]|uniref:NB-ARC domain-containing protein n=1 Tax=Micromonospora sp. NPDC048170 TaxID=3154819 RepID=UPI0033FE01DF